MNKARFFLFSALVAGLFLAPFCGSVAQAQDYKIAVVEMPTIIKEYKKREQLYNQLQIEVDKLQSEIETMGKSIENKKKRYETEGASMSDDARFDLRQEIETDFAKYRAELERRQRLIDTQEEKVLKEILTDIRNTIQEIATAEGYHLVLNSASTQGGVVYASDTIDITPKVLLKLNK